MKIPKAVKIGGIIYTVKTGVDRLQKGDGYCAEIDYFKCTMEISKNSSKQKAERDFLHEVVHAIEDNLGYKDSDEKRVDEMAGALYQLIVDNPEMFK